MAVTVDDATDGGWQERVARVWQRIPAIYIVLFIVLVAILIVRPSFFRPTTLLSFLQRAAPIIVVAIGQMYVLLSGEFDLSVGSLITVCAAIAAKVINNDPNNVGLAMVWLFGVALGIGLVNGVITTRFRVPSFVTTLGMLLALQGAISIYTRGAPQGGITDNFRVFGRGDIGSIPIALIIAAGAILVGVVLTRYTVFGRQVYAVGGNRTAAELSGINSANIKSLCFVLCALSGAVGAVLIAGFGGVSSLSVGRGYEFQSISAAVLGGVALGGGRGTVGGVVAGALTLQAIFSLLNFVGVPLPIRLTVEGVIIIASVALAAWRSGR